MHSNTGYTPTVARARRNASPRGTPVIVEHGTDYTFTIDSLAPDYTIVSNVLVDGGSVGSQTVPTTPAVLSTTYTFVNVTANHIISAEFDDFGDDCSGAVPVGVPPFVSARAGYIYPAGDVDYFQIDIPSYGTLEIYTSGGTDTAGTLLADDCTTIVAYNDDSTTLDNNFYIKQRGLPVGTYYHCCGALGERFHESQWNRPLYSSCGVQQQ